MSESREGIRTRLARAGLVDPADALRRVEALGQESGALVGVLAQVGDPDLALGTLGRVAQSLEHADPLLEALADEGTALRLLSVLGGSEALGDHLVRHPQQWSELADPHLADTRPPAYVVRGSLLEAVGADPGAATPVAGLADGVAVDALRVEYRRHLLRLAARDLAHDMGVDDVAAELAELAAGTLDAALAVARARGGAPAAGVRLAVVAMGKCGGHELNYLSDVDVIFVAEPAEPTEGVDGADPQTVTQVGGRLAADLMQVCSDHTAEGSIWQVDAALRPEGRNGPLVRTLASHEGYYQRWASTWEFQALLKARAVAGDLALGRAFTDLVRPMVWDVAGHDGFVEDVQAMRRRVVAHIPAREAGRQLKLGPGGLRDVEFAVQLLQLVHGRWDERIRQPTTLSALAALTRHGYVGRDDGGALHQAYSFLRRFEHRMQLKQLRRVHVVPDDEDDLRRIGRSMGFFQDPARDLRDAWRHHGREVRRLHEKLFYRPLLAAVAQAPTTEERLSEESARARLAALGFVDPAAALRHLQAMTSGVSRTAAIQRALLPVMLGWFSDAPDPDAGLFGFRRISESLGGSHWYLRALRDEGAVAENLARVLGSSRYATALLEKQPEGVRLLGGDLTPLTPESMTAEMLATARRQDSAEAAARAVRAVRRRELLRLSAAEIIGAVEIDLVGATLSRITDATLEAALDAVQRFVAEERGLPGPPTRMAIVAMGRYGGFELSYGSDADVMFVHDPLPDADPEEATAYATACVGELRRLLSAPGSDPPLEVDADLRPEGRQGAMVRTLESYRAYYARWSHQWEAQALLRADAAVGDEQLRADFTALIDPLRFPEEGISEDDIVEIRRIKARVDTERLPRGADPRTHLKLGRGGLADVEWTVQLLQMRHAGQHAGLRSPRTLTALDGAVDAGLVDEEDARYLAEAWRLASRVRNALTLVSGKPGDSLPSDARERAAVSLLLGHEPGHAGDLDNDWMRAARRARGVVDRVFWG